MYAISILSSKYKVVQMAEPFGRVEVRNWTRNKTDALRVLNRALFVHSTKNQGAIFCGVVDEVRQELDGSYTAAFDCDPRMTGVRWPYRLRWCDEPIWDYDAPPAREDTDLYMAALCGDEYTLDVPPESGLKTRDEWAALGRRIKLGARHVYRVSHATNPRFYFRHDQTRLAVENELPDITC